jgi:hypothetical protein
MAVQLPSGSTTTAESTATTTTGHGNGKRTRTATTAPKREWGGARTDALVPPHTPGPESWQQFFQQQLADTREWCKELDGDVHDLYRRIGAVTSQSNSARGSVDSHQHPADVSRNKIISIVDDDDAEQEKTERGQSKQQVGFVGSQRDEHQGGRGGGGGGKDKEGKEWMEREAERERGKEKEGMDEKTGGERDNQRESRMNDKDRQIDGLLE